MPARSREHTKKHTLRLRIGDAADIDAAFPSLGHNKVIRQLVADFVDKLRSKERIPEIEIKEVL